MKFSRLILLCLTALSSAQATINVSTINFADNVAWPQTPAFVVAGSANLYDSRVLRIENAAGFTIESVRIILDTTGTFDDSIAMDIDANGIIDYTTTQDDAYATPGTTEGIYTPWTDASPFTFDAVITQTGTTLTTYWNGVAITPGAGSPDTGFNDASGFTLQDWGFGAGGTITDSDFSTNAIRLGSINTDTEENHNIAFTFDAVIITDTEGNVYTFDPDGDGLPSAVPEPATTALIIAIGAFIIAAQRRNIKA
jgi:hypothetical protein